MCFRVVGLSNLEIAVSGFPEFILYPDQLDREYEGLVIKENEYFLNNIRANQFSLKKNILKLDQPVNKTR